jgi:hypothetical protein
LVVAINTKLYFGLGLVMAKTRIPAVYVASEVDQLVALKSRLRGRICDVVYNHGSGTVHEIADQLAVPVSTLYKHLELLVEVGLLLEGEPVRTTKNFARTYVAPARQLILTRKADDPEVVSALADILSSQLRCADKEVRKSIESQAASTSSELSSRVKAGSIVAWLSTREVEKLNRLVSEMFELFEGTGPGPGKELQGFTFASRPIQSTQDLDSN